MDPLDFLIMQIAKSITQFLPRLDKASYLCSLLILTTKMHPFNVQPSYIPIFSLFQATVYPVGVYKVQSLYMQINICNSLFSPILVPTFAYIHSTSVPNFIQIRVCVEADFVICARIRRMKRKNEEKTLKIFKLVPQRWLAQFTSNLECSLLL